MVLLQSTESQAILSRFILVIGFLIIALTLACLMFFIIARKKQNALFKTKKLMEEIEHQMMQTQIEVQELTINSIAKELHDNIGQLLSSTKLILGTINRNKEKYEDLLKMAEETISHAISELRSVTKSLDKDWLEQFQVIENLKTEVKRIEKLESLEILFEHSVKNLLFPKQQIMLFRIIQEAIQNVLKHAQASKLFISITETNECWNIIIEDNGVGFDINSIRNTSGILNIRYRTILLGGNAEWNSNKEKGTVLYIKIPLKEI